MRYQFSILLLLCFFSLTGQNKVCHYDGYSIYKGDTINRTIEKKKTGNWIFFNGIAGEIGCYDPGCACNIATYVSGINSEGTYLYGLKSGIWKYYDDFGSLKSMKNYNHGNLKQLIVYSNQVVKSGTDNAPIIDTLSFKYFECDFFENDTIKFSISPFLMSIKQIVGLVVNDQILELYTLDFDNKKEQYEHVGNYRGFLLAKGLIEYH